MPARAKAPKSPFATTQEVSAAAGEVHRDTLRRWCKMDLLPEPTIISRGRAGVHSRWPGWAVERAGWIHQQLETGYTLVEIAEQVKAGQAPAAVVEAATPELADEPGE
jgi:DNA-binding transcriptional MerR regulator